MTQENKSRSFGNFYESMKLIAERLKEGGDILLKMPTQDQEKWISMYLHAHFRLDVYVEPVWYTPNIQPVFDNSDIETPIIGFHQPDKKFSGYKITLKS